MGVGAQGYTKGTGQTKVGQLQVTLLVDQQVLRLEVAVQDAMGVAEADAMAELIHELLDDLGAQAQVCELVTGARGQSAASTAIRHRQSLHVLLEVEIEEFADEIELVTVGVNNVKQADNVGVSHLLEQRDFADGGRGDALIFGFKSDLLEGNDAIVVKAVECLVNDAICTYGVKSWSTSVAFTI